MYEIYDIVIILVYLILLIEDFKYAEFFYDFAIVEAFKSQERLVDGIVKRISDSWDFYFGEWTRFFKDMALWMIYDYILPYAVRLVFGAPKKKAPPQIPSREEDEKKEEK